MPWDGVTWIPHETVGGNATSFTDLMQYANTVTGDAFGLLLLGGIFMIIFIVGGRQDAGTGLASALFITTLLSFLLAAMDVVGDWVSWVLIFALMGSIVLLYKGGKNV